MKHKIKILIACLLMVCFCFPSLLLAAESTGSVEIRYHGYDKDGNKIILSNADFVFFKVGNKIDEQWKLDHLFKDSDVRLKESSASEWKKKAMKLYQYAKKEKIKGDKRKTDQNGKIKFQNLSEGLYLLAQTKPVSYNGKLFYKSVPTFIKMPVKIEGEYIYDQIIEPKSEWYDFGDPSDPSITPILTPTISPTVTPFGGDTPGGPSSGTPNNPPPHESGGSPSTPVETGDSTPVYFWMMLLLISAYLGMMVRNQRKLK